MRIEIDDPLPDPLPDALDLPLEDMETLISEFWPDDAANTLFWIILESYKKGLQAGLKAANKGPWSDQELIRS